MERMLRKKKDNSDYEIDRELTGKFAIEKNAEYQDRIAELEEENKNLNEKLEQAIYWKVDYEKSYKQADAKRDELLEENKNLKDRIDVLYEFIERNDKLVDEVIDEEDLDKLNRYIYIDDDLVDRTLESED